MSVTNGQLANQTVFNDAFVSRTAAQSIAGGKQFSGYVAMTRADVATASTITAMSSSTSFVKLTGSTVTEIQGVTAGINGQTLSIYNGSTAIVSFAHENGSASAANRIDLPENRSFYLYPDCTAKLVYESALSRWVLASAGPVFGNVAFQRSFKFTSTADNATGTGVTLTAVTTPLVSLTNASLASVGGVPAGEAGQVVYLINNTGSSLDILDEDGSTTAANRIRTGTAANVTIEDNATIILIYDSSDSRWKMIGSTGGGGGGGGAPTYSVESKTASFTAAVGKFYVCDATSGAITVTLPSAGSNSGAVIVVRKTDSSTNAVTLTSVAVLSTQNEAVTIISDGTNWVITERRIPSAWASYTMTIGATGSSPTKGTNNVDNAQWRRVGDSMEIMYSYRQTGAGSAGSGQYLFPVPSGYTIDTAKLGATAVKASSIVGDGEVSTNGIDTYSCQINVYNSSNLSLYSVYATGTSDAIGSAAVALSGASVQYSFFARVPISGWEG